MESSGFLSTSASFREEVNGFNMFGNYRENEEANHYDTSPENFSRSLLTSALDMTAKSLTLIHQDQIGWYFVTSNLKLMAAGKADLGAVLYMIETFMHQFSIKPKPNIEILKNYFDSLKEPEKKVHQELFRKIAELILETPKLFPNQVNLLTQGEFQSVGLSQRQCLCLVAHMFMCISVAPREDRMASFENIFHKTEKTTYHQVKMEKIKCTVNYFTHALKEKEERKIVFERIFAEKVQHSIDGVSYTIGNEDCSLETWKACNDRLLEFSYHHKGGMEADSNTIEIGFSGGDFGGQAIRGAATQQEIIILKSPECLPGFLLFDGKLDDGEAFCITGARSFNKCIGYEITFQWQGFYEKASSEFAKKTVFIDARKFTGGDVSQFLEEGIKRELTKAFIGFLAPSCWSNVKEERSVTTGRWGSGTNGGNPSLKFLIQWIAASRAKRKMEYYANGEGSLDKLVDKLQKHYKEREIKDLIGDILICARQAYEENNPKFDFFAAMKDRFNW